MNTPRPRIRIPLLLRALRRLPLPRKLGLLERLFAPALRPQSPGWASIHPGGLWKIDPRNATHRWMIYGDYQDPPFWRWVRRNRHALLTIADSGANIGQTVAYFSRICPRARLLAYEPGDAARAWLAESVTANHLTQVTIIPKALGAAAGTARLHPQGPPETHGSWNAVQSTPDGDISIAPLDDELAVHGVSSIDLWKIDLEGGEEAALQGASRLLHDGRISALFIESEPPALGRIQQLLEKFSYSGWKIRGSAFLPLTTPDSPGNFLFLHRHSPLLPP